MSGHGDQKGLCRPLKEASVEPVYRRGSVLLRPAAVILLCAVFLFCGAFSFASTVVLDPERSRIYQEADAAAILQALSDYDTAALTYHDQYLAVYGTIGSIGDGKRSFTLIPTGAGADAASVTCSISDASVRNLLGGFGPGDAVIVYGLSVTRKLPSPSAGILVHGVEKSTQAAADPAKYRFLYNDSFRRDALETRMLGNAGQDAGGIVKLYLPTGFSSVESTLPDVEGYLYQLNALPGSRKEEPEQLYVFWFDNEKYLSGPDEYSKTTQIEQAIIKNLLPGETIGFGKFPKKRDVYGRAFQYYDTRYGRYHAEFAFMPVKQRGILCFLYVYETSDHVDQILSLFRLIEEP